MRKNFGRLGGLGVLALSAALLASCAGLDSLDVDRVDQWERCLFTPAAARDLYIDTDVLVYATNQGFHYSENFERFRKPQADIPGDPEIVALAGASGIREIFAVSDIGYLLRSNDRARTFAMVGQFPHTRISDLALTTNGRLFAASASGVIMAAEDVFGRPPRHVRSIMMPWESLVLGLPIWRRANLNADTDLWKDWTVVLEGNVMRIAADPADPEHLIADVFDRGAVQTWDEGENWSALTAGGETIKGPIAFGPGGKVMVGAFLSRDGGRTWTRSGLVPDRTDLRQASDEAFPVHSVAITPSGYWAVHYRAAAVYTSGDGAAWRRAGEPADFLSRDRETSPATLAVDPEGNLWVGTEGHGLVRHRARVRVDK